MVKNYQLACSLFKIFEPNLGVLPLSGVDDCGAADLCDFLAVSVKAPAANFVGSNDILDEEHSVAGKKVVSFLLGSVSSTVCVIVKRSSSSSDMDGSMASCCLCCIYLNLRDSLSKSSMFFNRLSSEAPV